jgi:hypothetical protein
MENTCLSSIGLNCVIYEDSEKSGYCRKQDNAPVDFVVSLETNIMTLSLTCWTWIKHTSITSALPTISSLIRLD